MKISTILALVAAWLLTSGSAFATHKAWVLKNSGADCQFLSPTASDVVTAGGAIVNTTGSDRWVVCPITLASRWGSNGTTAFDAKTGVDARYATVYVNRLDSVARTVSCSATMTSINQDSYYSTTVSTTSGAGPTRVTLANQFGTYGSWTTGGGSTLEANEDNYAVSLLFSCSLPPNTAILGTKVKLCQLTSDCAAGDYDAENDQAGGTSTLTNYVQTSGMECSATTSASSVTKSVDGIKNTGASATSVFCPIVPPADDSWEILRDVWFPTVYYSGGQDTSNCVSAGTCPSCKVAWSGKDGVARDSGILLTKSPSRVVSASSKVRVDIEAAVGILCSLPAGTTLEGLTASVSIIGAQQGGI